MGVDTDGQICFGIVFEEGYSFPWDSELYDGIEDWWICGVNNYKPPFKLFNEQGEWIDGVRPPEHRIKDYYKHRQEFKKSIPSIPIEEVNYCSGDYPMSILAIPSSCLNASRGDPTEFDPTLLTVKEEDIEKLIKFCKDYCQPQEDWELPNLTPHWYLSSFWG